MGHKEKKSIEWHITPITFHIDGNIRKNEIPTKGQTSWGRRLLMTMILKAAMSPFKVQEVMSLEFMYCQKKWNRGPKLHQQQIFTEVRSDPTGFDFQILMHRASLAHLIFRTERRLREKNAGEGDEECIKLRRCQGAEAQD